MFSCGVRPRIGRAGDSIRSRADHIDVFPMVSGFERHLPAPSQQHQCHANGRGEQQGVRAKENHGLSNNVKISCKSTI